ncbi:MAG: hypothetical protein CND01_02410 [Marine Group II euryarchaeote MED-G34]|nr:MAG: hypothetical protein CND01_02410 [Marine Group II euryarchaeote MED-G34]
MEENEVESERLENPPPMFDKKEEAEAAFWRLKKASDKSREERVKRVLAQESEGILTTLGRVVYISACILFDGLVLMEIPVSMGKTLVAWTLYTVLLVVAIKLQYNLYEKWFDVDISEMDFDQQ